MLPSLSQITATFFTSLITRLGVRPPPAEAFLLSNVIQPVSLVDADISIPVTVSDPVFSAPNSAGLTTGPVVNTVLADTGQLAAGNWQFEVWMSFYDSAANMRLQLQHRDSANAANLWSHTVSVRTGGQGITQVFKWAQSLSLNERVRVINTIAATAGDPYHVNIFAKQLS